MAKNINIEKEEIIYAKDTSRSEDYHVYFDPDGYLKRVRLIRILTYFFMLNVTNLSLAEK